MQQLPKLVRQRLQANSAGQHPDSELLTAYVEQSLTARERLQMDDHLAGCSECRQVVALATPETVSPASTTGLQRAPARNWLRWNGLRWGTAAACLVVVGAAVMLNVREKANAPLRSEPQTARHVETAPSAPAPAPQYEAKAIPPASTMVLVVPTPDTRKATTGAAQGSAGGIGGGVFRAAPSRMSKDQQSANSPVMLFRSGQADVAPSDKKAAMPELKANTIADKEGQATRAKVATPAAPVATSSAVGAQALDRAAAGTSQMVEVTGESVTAESQTAEVAKQTGRDENGPPKRVATGQSVVTFSPKPLPQVAANARNMVDFKVPRWTLSENGLPQRSFDSGSTWEEIQVDHKTGFRALSAVGMDVWVGGKSGLLYHTADMGLHWAQITPASSGASLSDDIVRIEFADQQHGRVIAGDGQSWVTSDGGKTWERH